MLLIFSCDSAKHQKFILVFANSSVHMLFCTAHRNKSGFVLPSFRTPNGCQVKFSKCVTFVSLRNSETVTYFWANWNIPVHKWCLRWALNFLSWCFLSILYKIATKGVFHAALKDKDLFNFFFMFVFNHAPLCATDTSISPCWGRGSTSFWLKRLSS